jgi:GNAT superfamily N-acetyltransferase
MLHTRDDYELTTDLARIDVKAVHEELSERTYWAKGMPIETLRRALENSLCFGISRAGRLAAFGRVITDRATYAYLSDVFVVEAERGRGLSKWMMEHVIAHPELQGLRRFALMTKDAHKLYEKFGFSLSKTPERYMESVNPDVYKKLR